MSAPRSRQATATRGGPPSRSPAGASEDSAAPRASADAAGRPGASGAVELTTFGYKFGDPPPADLTFDVRFLANPFWIPDLRPRSGLDPAVRDYVLGQADASAFLTLVEDMIRVTLPNYLTEGRRGISVALGCTGGFHRSIALAEELGQRLRQRGMNVSVHHRELAA